MKKQALEKGQKKGKKPAPRNKKEPYSKTEIFGYPKMSAFSILYAKNSPKMRVRRVENRQKRQKKGRKTDILQKMRVQTYHSSQENKQPQGIRGKMREKQKE